MILLLHILVAIANIVWSILNFRRARRLSAASAENVRMSAKNRALAVALARRLQEAGRS